MRPVSVSFKTNTALSMLDAKLVTKDLHKFERIKGMSRKYLVG